jgi:hypothetical protein
LKKLNKEKATELLSEKLGWQRITDCQNGFWLDDYTFLKPDSIEVVIVGRESGKPSQKSEDAPMLVLNDLVEMMVDKNRKIVSVEMKKSMGLWVDAVSTVFERKAV